MPSRRNALDQIRLCDDAGAAAGKLALDPLENIDLPAGAPQQQRRQEAAHRAADHQRAAFPLRNRSIPPFSCREKLLYISTKPGGMPWP